MWRHYHDLGPDLRPLAYPDMEPVRVANPARYRRLLYGFAKAAAVIEEGAPAGPPPPPRRRKAREEVTKGGVVLPTGVPTPEG